jgi:hypothetical protein
MLQNVPYFDMWLILDLTVKKYFREVYLQGGPDSIRQFLIINNQSIQQHTGKMGKYLLLSIDGRCHLGTFPFSRVLLD